MNWSKLKYLSGFLLLVGVVLYAALSPAFKPKPMQYNMTIDTLFLINGKRPVIPFDSTYFVNGEYTFSTTDTATLAYLTRVGNYWAFKHIDPDTVAGKYIRYKDDSTGISFVSSIGGVGNADSLGGQPASAYMSRITYDYDLDDSVDVAEAAFNSLRLNNKLGNYYLNRTNHTGTQTASTISDFDTEVSNNTSVQTNATNISNNDTDISTLITWNGTQSDSIKANVDSLAKHRVDINNKYGSGDNPIFTTITVDSLKNSSNIVVDIPNGGAFQPSSNDGIALGTYQRKWLNLWASELNVQTLVSQNVLATIGGEIKVAPTTKLTRDCAAIDDSVYVDHNSFQNNDIIYLNVSGSTEYMRVTGSGTSVSEGYRFPVVRNLDGSEANAFYTGDAVIELGGQVNQGWIDISQSSMQIIGNVRNSTTYNDYSAKFVIGDLSSVSDPVLNPTGYGIWTSNGYFTGEIVADSGFIGGSSGWEIGSSKLTSTNIGLISGANAEILLGHPTSYSSAKIGLKNDGSGKLADGNINWNVSGDVEITGEFTTNADPVHGDYYIQVDGKYIRFFDVLGDVHITRNTVGGGLETNTTFNASYLLANSFVGASGQPLTSDGSNGARFGNMSGDYITTGTIAETRIHSDIARDSELIQITQDALDVFPSNPDLGDFYVSQVKDSLYQYLNGGWRSIAGW